MYKKLVVSLVSIAFVGCSTQPTSLPPPKCEYKVGTKCKQFTADDIQGGTTYGHSDEN